MTRSNAILQLLDDLGTESSSTTVVTIKKSSAVIYLNDDDEKGITFAPEECELLFNSTETVEQLFEALGRPPNASVELVSLSLEQEVMDALNETFATVQDG